MWERDYNDLRGLLTAWFDQHWDALLNELKVYEAPAAPVSHWIQSYVEDVLLQFWLQGRCQSGHSPSEIVASWVAALERADPPSGLSDRELEEWAVSLARRRFMAAIQVFRKFKSSLE